MAQRSDPDPEASSRAREESEQAAASETSEERLHRLEDQVGVLAEAVRMLARGLETSPTEEPDPEKTARAARLAHEILLYGGL